MPKKSVDDRARDDLELARFLERERAKRSTEKGKPSSAKPYAKNHLPETRDLSEEAAEAIRDMVTR